MKNCRAVTNRGGSDEAVDRRADRHSFLPSLSEKQDRLVEEFARHWIFDRTKVVQKIAHVFEHVVIIDALQHLLDDGQTCDDLVDANQLLDTERRMFAECRNPDARINDDHKWSRSSAVSTYIA